MKLINLTKISCDGWSCERFRMTVHILLLIFNDFSVQYDNWIFKLYQFLIKSVVGIIIVRFLLFIWKSVENGYAPGKHRFWHLLSSLQMSS